MNRLNVDGPAADDLVKVLVGGGEEVPAFAERQVPHEARHDPVVHVEVREPVVARRIVVVQEPLPARQVLPDAGGGRLAQDRAVTAASHGQRSALDGRQGEADPRRILHKEYRTRP